MPGIILDALLAQVKQTDLENFSKKMETKESEREKVRPEGVMTIEELMRRRAENLEMDFVDVPTSSEEVEANKQQEFTKATETKPVDSGSSQIMKDFLNKLKG